jgi:hypothetical protein
MNYHQHDQHNSARTRRATTQEIQLLYCNQAYSSDMERVQHIDCEQPGKMYYPIPEDFEMHLS